MFPVNEDKNSAENVEMTRSMIHMYNGTISSTPPASSSLTTQLHFSVIEFNPSSATFYADKIEPNEMAEILNGKFLIHVLYLSLIHISEPTRPY